MILYDDKSPYLKQTPIFFAMVLTFTFLFENLICALPINSFSKSSWLTHPGVHFAFCSIVNEAYEARRSMVYRGFFGEPSQFLQMPRYTPKTHLFNFAVWLHSMLGRIEFFVFRRERFRDSHVTPKRRVSWIPQFSETSNALRKLPMRASLLNSCLSTRLSFVRHYKVLAIESCCDDSCIALLGRGYLTLDLLEHVWVIL